MLTLADQAGTAIRLINPLSDQRWDDFVGRHPQASVFHERGWLEALSRTYGYQPQVLTSASADEPLRDGIVFCHVSSWITGRRLVSLPFSDHCEPLFREVDRSADFINSLRSQSDKQRCQFLEVRPIYAFRAGGEGLRPVGSYWLHELDLRLPSDQLFRGLHKNSFQRKIRRAEKESVTYERGRSERLLEDFYHLLLITRRRHRLLPQPRRWFENLLECMGEKLEIWVARKDGSAIAAMLTLRHHSCLVYKYGCSDAKAHNQGGMPFLFWRVIEESKQSGIDKIDLGRTDLDNDGLILFKDRLGARKQSLTYYRYANRNVVPRAHRWEVTGIRELFAHLPDAVLSTAGGMLYRHLG